MQQQQPDDFDLAVIGAGSGGLVAAIVAQKLGLKTALIEGNLFGGDCLNFGCVPSKSLIHSANIAANIRNAEKHGLKSISPEFDWQDITKRISDIQDHIREHETADYFRNMGITVFESYASLINPHTIEMGDNTITARKIVIATGTSSFIPEIVGIEETGYITNENIFTLEIQPNNLAIIGGGPIGVEMAQAFARLGTKVTVIEYNSNILIREDEDMALVVQKSLKQDGVQFHFNSKVIKASKQGEMKTIEIERNGNTLHISTDEILIATGRKPNLEKLNLKAADVKAGKRGIEVNSRMQTSQKHIYAVGDCTGGYMFTHAASMEASVALRNIVFRLPAKVNYKTLGWCTYTEPELASVGYNEQRAKEAGIAYEIAEAEFADNDRALAESSTTGKIKVLFKKGLFKKKIIGAQIVGPHAGELIHEYVLTISKGMSISDMAGPTHLYPTLSEINRRVAIDYLTKSFFSNRTRKWLKRIFRYRGSTVQAD